MIAKVFHVPDGKNPRASIIKKPTWVALQAEKPERAQVSLERPILVHNALYCSPPRARCFSVTRRCASGSTSRFVQVDRDRWTDTPLDCIVRDLSFIFHPFSFLIRQNSHGVSNRIYVHIKLQTIHIIFPNHEIKYASARGAQVHQQVSTNNCRVPALSAVPRWNENKKHNYRFWESLAWCVHRVVVFHNRVLVPWKPA